MSVAFVRQERSENHAERKKKEGRERGGGSRSIDLKSKKLTRSAAAMAVSTKKHTDPERENTRQANTTHGIVRGFVVSLAHKEFFELKGTKSKPRADKQQSTLLYCALQLTRINAFSSIKGNAGH